MCQKQFMGKIMKNKIVFSLLLLMSFTFISCPRNYAIELEENINKLLSESRIIIRDEDSILLEKGMSFSNYISLQKNIIDVSSLDNNFQNFQIIIKMKDGDLYAKEEFIDGFYISNITVKNINNEEEKSNETQYCNREDDEESSILIMNFDNSVNEVYSRLSFYNRQDLNKEIYTTSFTIKIINNSV